MTNAANTAAPMTSDTTSDTAPDTTDVYPLLPAIVRRRDAEQGQPLKALLDIVSRQAAVVEDDLAGLYRNWFIETCQDWVIPYLGDLVGYQLLPGVDAGNPNPALAAPRADVADTIGDRRRKGTLALFERLAADVARWPARAVELRQLVGITEPVRRFSGDAAANAARLATGGYVDLRNGDALERLDGPFDQLAHTVEVARIDTDSRPDRRRGRANLPHVGVFVWRLGVYSRTHAPAFVDGNIANHSFILNPLGMELPLVCKPVPDATQSADEPNVPAFIRRRAFAANAADYYGVDKSLCLWRDDEADPVPLSQILCTDLNQGGFTDPAPGTVNVDPVLGRAIFAPDIAPKSGLRTTFHYAFPADLGGGEYPRQVEAIAARYPVGPSQPDATIAAAITRWQADRTADPNKARAVIEIIDSGIYTESLTLSLALGDDLTLRAANGAWPLLDLTKPLTVTSTATTQQPVTQRPTLTLDGLLVRGAVAPSGMLGAVTLRHTTLVPPVHLAPTIVRATPAASAIAFPAPTASAAVPAPAPAATPAAQPAIIPSLHATDLIGDLTIDHCVLGALLIDTSDTVTHDPPRLVIRDSVVVDKSSAQPAQPVALGTSTGSLPYVALTVQRSTIDGQAGAHAADLVENSIFGGPFAVARRQHGCVRFSWIPTGSRTPRRYHCQPDLVTAAAGPTAAAQQLEAARVAPLFTATDYGAPGFYQLHRTCAQEITRGADDASELGAYHDLFQPQREDGLRLRLNEHCPAGNRVGILFAS